MTDARRSARGRAGERRGERVLVQRVEERTRELTALLEVSRSINSTLALAPLLDLILDQLLRVIDYRSAGVFLARGDALETVAMRDIRDPTRDRSQVGYRPPMAQRLAIWQVIQRGEPVVIGDVRRDDALARAWRGPSGGEPGPTRSPVRAWMAVPLSARGRVFGMLALTRDVPDSFTARDTELALAFAGHASTAVENARLLGESEQRAAELAALLEVSRSAASTLELEPLLNNVLDTLKLVVDYDGASIGVVDGDEFRFLESRGASSAEREPEMIGVRLPMHEPSGLWEPLFRHEPVIIADVRDGSAAARAFRRTVGEHYDAPAMRYVRSFMDIPLVNRDRLVGLLIMTNRQPGAFTERHAGLALAIATHIAGALENARLHDQTEQRAHEQATLLEVSRSLSSTLALEPLLDLILERLLGVVGYRGASIIVCRDDALETVASHTMWEDGGGRSEVGYTVALARALPIWQAVLRGEPVVIGDVRGDDPFARTWREASSGGANSPVRAWLGVPLSARGEVFGFLALTRDVPDSFTAHETELAVAFAGHAAVAIDNARLLGDSERRTRELTALLGVAGSLASTIELEPLLDVVLDQIKVVAEYDGAVIVSHEDDGDQILRRRAPTALWPGHDGSYRVGPAFSARVSEAFSRREAVIIDDFPADHLVAGEFRAGTGTAVQSSPLSYVRSWMTVPLTLTDRVIGQIVLSHSRPAYYTPHHAELVTAIAAQAAAAIEKARLLAESERRARELATLLEVSRAVASTLELGPLLDLILDQLKVVVDYRGATLGTITGDELFIAASRGDTPERASDRGLRLTLRRLESGWEALARGEPVIIADVRGDTPAAVEYRAVNAAFMDRPSHRDIRSWMAVPLALGDRVIGMLSMSQDVPDYFTRHHADLALAFANQAAVAVENARLYGEAQGKAALEERQRLARELHDSVSQALFGIALGASAARRRLDVDPARVAESLDYVLSLADAALTEMRALIFELRPETLEKDGLVAALSRHAEATRARHEIAVETALCEEPHLPLATKEALYRIAQEAIHNTVKHARAGRIDIRLARVGDGVALEVADDGAGFDPSGAFPGHLGLVSMRERVERLGGTLAIESAPGRGTALRAHIPIVA